MCACVHDPMHVCMLRPLLLHQASQVGVQVRQILSFTPGAYLVKKNCNYAIHKLVGWLGL